MDLLSKLRGYLHDNGATFFGSVFVYMIPKQNVMPARVIPARVQTGSCAGARFSSRHENSFRCHVNGV